MEQNLQPAPNLFFESGPKSALSVHSNIYHAAATLLSSPLMRDENATDVFGYVSSKCKLRSCYTLPQGDDSKEMEQNQIRKCLPPKLNAHPLFSPATDFFLGGGD